MIDREAATRRTIRRLMLAGLFVTAALIGGVGTWAAMTHVAGAVVVPGVLVVESNVKKVQHNAGGIVAEILVKEGDIVKAGDLLARLDDTLARATLGVIQAQLDVLLAREARLSAEIEGAESVAIPATLRARQSEPTVAAAIGGETKLFQSRRTARAGQRSQLNERIAQTESEVTGLTAQQAAKEKEIGFISDELAGLADLFKRNLVTVVRYMALQRDQTRLEGERGQLVADIARAKGRIAEFKLQILQLDQDFRTEVLRDIREAQARISELQERANAARDELRRIDIRAPQGGTVYQLNVHTIGGVVARGETLMQILPRNDTLIVEAKLSPTDVDQVAVGGPARVRLMAANRRTLPDLNGVVTFVGPNLEHEQPAAGGSSSLARGYFPVRVQLAKEDVAANSELQLVPGMFAEVFVLTQDRTVLDYLIKPLTEQISRTFREH